MTNWAEIQAETYSNATNKAKALSDMIINAKLSKQDLESIYFIVSLELMKRKERKEEKKIIRLEKYKEQAAQQVESESES